jgi:hypothetical protein
LVRDATARYSKERLHAVREHTGRLSASTIITTDDLIAALPESAGEAD